MINNLTFFGFFTFLTYIVKLFNILPLSDACDPRNEDVIFVREKFNCFIHLCVNDNFDFKPQLMRKIVY